MAKARLHSALGFALLLAAACGKDSVSPGGTAARLVAGDGGGQSGTTGTVLPLPLRVSVLDALDQPVAGVTVAWSVVSGGGSVSAASSVSDGQGLASVTVTLGAAPGTQQVRAAVTGLAGSPVTFSETAQPFVQAAPVLLQTIAVPADYGAHDTFVRDGLAFAFLWNTGLRIYDVGNGIRGGSPESPQLVSSFVTATAGSVDGPNVHNGWWFHNPVSGEKRYLFIGQEGPSGGIGSRSTGDIHVVDVSNLAAPHEVAFYHHPSIAGDSVGVHNFWMDEPAQILFAAFYNGGVVALDVSGALTGDLSGRVISEIRPGGAGNTYTWGVQLWNGSLYAIDMLTGLYQLKLQGNTLSRIAGGNNVPERFSSDLWVQNGFAYTGTWGTRSAAGNVLKVWRLDASGAPSIADSIKTAGIGTVSDVEVSADGKWLLFTAEGGSLGGLYLYSLADPAHPAFATSYIVPTGLHTGTFATINGRRYVFAAKDPASPAMMIFDVTAATS